VVKKGMPCQHRNLGDTLVVLLGVIFLLAFLGMAYFMVVDVLRALGQ
jgi:Tfp pilus assembly protein PilX